MRRPQRRALLFHLLRPHFEVYITVPPRPVHDISTNPPPLCMSRLLLARMASYNNPLVQIISRCLYCGNTFAAIVKHGQLSCSLILDTFSFPILYPDFQTSRLTVSYWPYLWYNESYQESRCDRRRASRRDCYWCSGARKGIWYHTHLWAKRKFRRMLVSCCDSSNVLC